MQMFSIVTKTFKKALAVINYMFTEDKIATAQLAQIFGSELLKVQSSATTDSGATPDIVKINPQQFLIDSQQYQSAKKAEEQRLIQMLQREAEAACPLPLQPAYEQPSTQPLAQEQPQQPKFVAQESIIPPQQQFRQSETVHMQTNSPAFERIAYSLERIANKLDGVDITLKKKRIKRSIK